MEREKRTAAWKKVVSLVLAVTTASSVLCSCGKDAKADDELLDLTKSGVKLVLDRKISKLSKISTSDFEEVKSDWADDLDFTAAGKYSADERTAFGAISDTIDYKIDEDSVDSSVKYGEGKVRVEFTMADYSELFGDAEAMNDSGSFVNGLSSCGDKEIEVWFDFELDGDTWLISNSEEILNTVYSFRNERITFVPDLSRASFDCSWYGTDGYGDNIYTNTFSINYEIYFYDNSDTSQVYFTVDYNGAPIYTSSRGVVDAYFTTDTAGAPLSDTGMLADGEYTITFYDGSDHVISSDTCEVYNTVPSPSDYINWYFYEQDWGVYALYDDATVIDADLDLGDLNNYASVDFRYTVTFDGEIVYTDYDFMGYFYASDQDSGDWYLDPGLYQIDFYDNSTDELAVTAYAVVLRDGVGADDTYLGGFLGMNVTGRNMDAQMLSDFSSAYWYSTDPASPADGMIFSSADTLTYRIPVSQDYGTLNYDITYSADGDADDPYADTIQSANTAELQYDAAGNMYYEITYDGTVDAGYYRVTVLAEGGMDFTVFSVCQVQG